MRDFKINVDKYPLQITILLTIFLFLTLYYKYIFGGQYFIFTDVGSDTNNVYVPLLILKSYLSEKFSFFTFYWGLGESILKNIFLLDIFTLPIFFMNEKQVMQSLIYVIFVKHILISFFFFKILSYYNFSAFSKIVASLLMTYSAFVIIWGQHYMFSSLVTIFLALLWTFEVWLQEKKYLFFVVLIAYFSICCGSFSLVFLVQLIIFLFFYGLLRYLWLFNTENFITFCCKTLLLFILAFFIASFYLLPVINMLLESPRITGNYFNLNNFFEFLPFGFEHFLINLLRLFSNDLLGVGDVYTKNVRFFNFYEAGNLYSGLLTLLLIPLTFYKTTKYQKILLLVSVILLYLFFNNKLFMLLLSGYSKQYEFRYGYLFSVPLLIGLASSITKLEQYEIKKNILFISYLFLILFSSLIVYMILRLNISTEINSKSIIKFFMINFLFISLYLYFIIEKFKENKTKLFILVLVLVEIFIQSYSTINKRDSINNKVIENKIGYFDNTQKAIEYIKEKDKTSFYRIFKNYNSVFLNDSIMQKFYGINAYSNLNSHTKLMWIFNRTLQSPHYNFIWSSQNLMYLNSLLSVKYVLSKNQIEENEFFQYLNRIDDIYIYENKKFLSLGILYTTSINEDDLLLNNSNIEEKMYSSIILPSTKTLNIEFPSIKYKEDELINLQKMEIISFNQDDIKGEIKAQKDGILLFQIPYDKGWSLSIDGVEKEINQVDFSLMGVEITKGQHFIELKYFPYLMKEGLFLTFFGLVCLIILYFRRKTK